MSSLAVLAFLAGKGVRYAMSNRERLDWVYAWSHLRAALRPRANFVFQSRYGGDADDGAYARWLALHEAAPEASQDIAGQTNAAAVRAARIALIVGDGMDERQIRAALRSLGDRPDMFEIAPVRAAVLAGADGADQRPWDFALVLDRPGVFAPMAAARMLTSLLDNPGAQAVFADSDTAGKDGRRHSPMLKPPLWDTELLWSSDYIGAPLLLRWTSEIPDVLKGPAATARPSYALALMLSATVERSLLMHIPAVLFHQTAAPYPDASQRELTILNEHLRRIRHPRRAEMTGGARRVAWPLPDTSKVSIIIPSKDNPGLLKTCIESIGRVTVGPTPEIIVADNGSVKPAALDYLRRLELDGAAVVIPCPGPFNFSKINNDARRHATGDILVFLNDDTRVLSPDWLVELASLAARPDVGAVGAMLLYPDGTVQHAGVLLGIRGIADHAFRHEDGHSPGYLGLLRCRREVAAVTGACLAVSAAHFDAVSGFDEALAVTANDIDLCLRLRASGWKTVWSPWCVLEHAESKSRGVDSTDAALNRQARETLIFHQRWGHLLEADPAYNPGLSRVAPNFSLGVE